MLILSGFAGPIGATDLSPAYEQAKGQDLSVKEYTVSGVKVWGSYQSPDADKTLRSLKSNMNRLGASVSSDGLIGSVAVSRLNDIADRFITNTAPLKADGIASDTAQEIRKIARNGSAETVAKRGYVLNYYVKTLADTFGSASPTSGGGGGSSTSYPSNLPVPTGAEDLFPSSGATDTAIVPTTKKAPSWPYVIGGVAVAGGLAFIIWTVLGTKKSKNTVYRQANAW